MIELLGRGGMGEVYRADDLEVGQEVALKFLPSAVAGDEIALARLRNEVRLARQISHPNVCRVFDLGHLDGQYFISMEYVDGEDLASVIRRMGRPSAEKAIQMARQVCAGLAAAHANGVLHRDLKPANIMLDGRGRVRLMDFGLSGLAQELHSSTEFAGTPIYMAPEQLDGSVATVRTDVYALGAVLYELITGERPFPVDTLTELKRLQHGGAVPLPPSHQAPGLDPAYDAVILRCLQLRPEARPSSVAEVAASLGSENALQEALAAGETPSPELLAAAGVSGVLTARVASLLLAGVAVILVGAVALARYSTVLGLAGLEKSPEVLIDHSREIIKASGVSAPARDSAYGFFINWDFVNYLGRQNGWRNWGHQLRQPPGALRFWYRQSPEVLAPADQGGIVGQFDPPINEPGMANLILDAQGLLRKFEFVPPLSEPSNQALPAVNWDPLFAAAGLDQKQFVPAEPQWIPQHAFDVRMSWHGMHNGVPVHIDAAAFHGVPVVFDVNGPWSAPGVAGDHRRSVLSEAAAAANALIAFGLIAAGLFLVRSNLRAGRADRRGALRVALYFLVAAFLCGVLAAHWPASLPWTWSVFSRVAGNSLFGAAFVWLAYMALDPFARRYWPDLLISWNRLLAGRSRDPLVGRDVLVGVLVGCLLSLFWNFTNVLPFWYRMPEVVPDWFDAHALDTLPQALAVFIYKQIMAIIAALAVTLILVLARLVLRRKGLALIVTCLAISFLMFRVQSPYMVPASLLSALLITVVLVRSGILVCGTAIFVLDVLGAFPMTLDLSRWYAGRSVAIMLFVLAMAAYGFKSALGNKALFADLLDRV